MMDSRDRAAVRTWNDALDLDVSISVLATDDERSDRIAEAADEYRRTAPRLTVSTVRRTGSGAPAILVGDRIACHAAPEGTELAPFLEAVRRFGCGREAHGASPRGTAQDGGLASGVRLYVSAHCPHCPGATRTLLDLLDRIPSATLTVVDVELFPEMAARDLVRSVPTVIVGRRYRSTGSVSLDAVRAALAGEGPDAASLGRLLDGGEAAAVAAMMADAAEVFSAVIDRLAHDTISVRLGAMAALERLVETSPDVARQAEPGIWDRLPSAGPQAAGDMLYILGEAGSAASLTRLAAFRDSTPNEDLREAAADAMVRIDERDGGTS